MTCFYLRRCFLKRIGGGDSVLWELQEEGVRGGPVGLRLFFPSLVPGSLLFGAASLTE